MLGTLIADAGSTKTSWAYLKDNASAPVFFKTSGINPIQQNSETIRQIIGSLVLDFTSDKNISKIFYYGTGCLNAISKTIVREAFEYYFGSIPISIESDLTGAARALFNNRRGIACILGTGSNSGLFINGQICDQIPSLGYILGDEGSGAYLGKRFINDLFKKRLSKKITDSFFSWFYDNFKEYQNYTDEIHNMNHSSSGVLSFIIEKTYKNSMPSSFLASFVPFLTFYKDLPEIRILIKEGFLSFYKRNVMAYPEYTETPIGFIGSVATTFSDILMETASECKLNISDIISDPINGLISYHKKFVF